MIYTSYFANINKIPRDFVKVSIARFPPKGLLSQVKQCLILAPSPELLKAYKNHQISDLEYTNRYQQQLNAMPVDTKRELFEYLKYFNGSQNHNLVLLCYETPNAFCHRHIFANMCYPILTIKEL